MIDLTQFKEWLLLNGASKASTETHYQKVKSYFKKYDLFTTENINSFFYSKLDLWNGNTFNIFLNALKHYAKFTKTNIEFPLWKKIEEKVMPYITEKEFTEILDKLPLIFEDNYLKIKVILFLMLETGCRPKEIKELKREDFDLENKNVVIKNTKTHSDRKLPLSDSLCKLLPDIFQQEAEIINAFNITKQGLGYIFIKINKCLNLKKKLTPYSMRRIYAHNMLKKGLPLSSLQIEMGHKNITTTLGYLKVNEEEANEEARKILNKRK
jgi:integrase